MIPRRWRDAFLHFLFPHICDGCGTDVLPEKNALCLRCISELPRTRFEFLRGNPVEKRFYGRLNFIHASAHLFFAKNSVIATLVHQVKYSGNRELGVQLGKMMGRSLHESSSFNADALIPLPLFADRERQRGYNQSLLLCEGIAEHLNIPIMENVIERPLHTDTQTNKGRIERWRNMEGKFFLKQPGLIAGKHILLVDDVITTGATIESCGAELLRSPGSSLSIACLCQAFS